MSLNPQQEQELEKLFETKLKEQYYKGMGVGFKTACHAVLEILEDKKLHYAKRMEAAKKFCRKPLTEQKTEKQKKQNEELEQIPLDIPEN